MKIFLVTYKNKFIKKDGFLLLKGKTWEDINSFVKQKFNDTLIINGILKCEEIFSDSVGIIYKYEKDYNE